MEDTDCGPLLVDGQKRVLVEVGKMTASKGLKIFRDSVTYTRDDIDAMSRRLYHTDSLFLLLQDSAERHLTPFHPLCDEYKHTLAVFALNPEDVGNNIILASLLENGKMKLNYRGDSTLLSPMSITIDKYEKWSSIDQLFRNDSMEVHIKGYLADSVDQKYIPGLGYFDFAKDGSMLAKKKIYLLYKSDYFKIMKPLN
jgi:hypothetical protein